MKAGEEGVSIQEDGEGGKVAGNSPETDESAAVSF